MLRIVWQSRNLLAIYHRSPRWWLSVIMVCLIGGSLIFGFSYSTTLTCERSEMTVINCQISNSIGLGFVKVQETNFYDVKNAILKIATRTIPNENGEIVEYQEGYQVQINTAAGEIPLQSNESDFKIDLYTVASEINKFIQNPTQLSLTKTQNEFWNLVTVVAAVWLAIAFPVALLSGQTLYLFDKQAGTLKIMSLDRQCHWTKKVYLLADLRQIQILPGPHPIVLHFPQDNEQSTEDRDQNFALNQRLEKMTAQVRDFLHSPPPTS